MGERPDVGPGLGIYVHVPFCASRCDYCAFATWTGIDHLSSAYVDSCLKELEGAYAMGLGEAATVFFGGGTPSRLKANELARVLRKINRRDGAEVTVECNPEDVTSELLATYATAGVNRLSLGVQSLTSHVLESLGRRHSPEAVAPAAAIIGESGLGPYSVDLIYGARGESDEDWMDTLRGVLALEPPPAHVSAYALQAEPGTPLWRDRERHPDDDVQARRYEVADEVLSGAGLYWYEISKLVATWVRVPTQPELLEPGRIPRNRLRGPQPSRGAPLLEHPHPGALHGRHCCSRLGGCGRGKP